MKNTYYINALFVVMFMATVFSVLPISASASPRGNAYGYWSFLGNSEYGRLHNTNNFIRKYQWGNSEFESFQEMIDHIRAYLYEWKTTGMFDDNDSEIEISTKNATNIDDDKATLQGEIEIYSSDYAHVWFSYGKNLTSLTKNTPTIYIEEDDDRDTFSSTITNLSSRTRYYFRAVGEDEDGERDYGKILSFVTDSSNSNDEEEEEDDGDNPSTKTLSATDIVNTSAEIHGEVDMNDFNNGTVFFVYGEDDAQIEDTEDEYDTFSDIEEDGDDLRKIKVDSDLDDSEDYSRELLNLSDDTTYYFAIGVAYEDEDGDDTIILGSIKSFTTGDDGDSTDTDPDAVTGSASSIDTDSANLRGEVDMNDFENGIVFFVYGENENQIEDVEDAYVTYADIDEDGDDLQKFKVDSDLDDEGTYTANVFGLDSGTTIYYAIGVDYEDEDGNDTIILGSVKSFTTQ